MDVAARLSSVLSDRYRIEREIGAGGMATVYLARDLKHNRKVALKVLRPELGAVLGVERFLSEIEVTANLQHPHLLPLFDSGEAAGLLFYVMPFVQGESLRDRLKRERQLPVDEAIRIAVAVASALDYAHRHNVIHRDLKPENILLHDGQPLVTDFGIALAITHAGGTRVTQTGLSLGTPQYMSPEQATGDRVIDARTDIYSLAAVLYEMLTGEAPHTGSTVQAIIAKVLTDKPRHVRHLRDTVPEHVDAALMRALAKLPADRFASASEFADALTNPRAVVRPPDARTVGPYDAAPTGAALRRRRITTIAPCCWLRLCWFWWQRWHSPALRRPRPPCSPNCLCPTVSTP
jgi:serine/threonine-protein kinase